MKTQRIATFVLLASVAAWGAGCSSKSPTAPNPNGGGTQTPPPPPSISDSITVSANPGSLVIGTNQSSTINVHVVQSTGGPPPDGTSVTLTATGGVFGSITGSNQTILQLVNGFASAQLFAGLTAGTATITAVIPATPASPGVPANLGGTGAAQVRITNPGTFFISSVTPNVGNAQGGDTVTINGGGFSAPVRVTFAAAAAQVLSISPSAVKVITPSATSAGVTVGVGQTASVAVTVINSLNSPSQATDTIPAGFTYSLGGPPTQPQVFSVNPASGPDSGGTTITIVGQGFQAPVQVFFGSGSSAASFNGIEGSVTSVTATKLVVITPSASGFGQSNVDKTVDILVKNVNSGFSTVSPQSFKYGSGVIITSAGPVITQWNQPVKVTIFGQGFQSPVAVTLAGVGAQVVSVSGTEVDVLSGTPEVTGCTDVAGPIGVTNIDTGQGASALTFDYQVDHPSISNISPIAGSGNGLYNVTVKGFNFDNPLRVSFGQQAGNAINPPTCTVNGNCSIQVTVPPFTGTFPTGPCTGSGGQTGTMNLPTSVDVTLTNLGTTCNDTLKGGFTYNPPDSSCHVTPPVAPVAAFSISQMTGSFTVVFLNQSTGSITSYLWDFGDGSAQVTTQNPTHTYPSVPKTYVVTLTVTGPGGTSSASQFVTVPGT